MVFKIDIISYWLMEDNAKPDPRWNEFIEQLDQKGKPIGFKLPNNDFLFEYDVNGGWEDEQGRYYSADGILQPDDENDSQEEDDDADDEVVDKFEKLLREEEEGIVRKGSEKKGEKDVQPSAEYKKEKEVFDYKTLLAKFNAKELLRQNLPSDLFIYFKQRVESYEEIEPVVEKHNDLITKNEAVKEIKKKIEQKRKQLLAQNDWLNEQGVFLDFSGDSEEETFYDRYWYGVIRTTPDKYLDLLEKIANSKDFKILQIKTYYALKSKFYLKKSQEKIKKTISHLRETIQTNTGDNQVVSLLIDGLPEQFPCSYIYDLVEYSGGSLQNVESVIIEDNFSATVTCLKRTALLLINIEGYNHDKGEFIQISYNEVKDREYVEGKQQLYYITVDSKYKIHERELQDTLALEKNKTEIVRLLTKAQDDKEQVRFVIGSIPALKRVLMFRGDSLNVVRVLPSVPK